MLKQADSLGVSKLVATPHINEQTSPDKIERIRKNFEELDSSVQKLGMNIDVSLAAEVNFDSKVIDWIDHPWILIGKNIKYMLIELPLFGLPVNILDIIFNIQLKNIIPILAHPERNIRIQENPNMVIDWIKKGCIIQMDAGSIMGQFGIQCKTISERLLKSSNIHLIGSDSHDLNSRNYEVFYKSYQYVKTKIDTKYAEILFYNNPQRILNGESIINQYSEGKINSKNILKKILKKMNFIL